ncbi:unnamed protein product [Prunus armeniaca]
MGGVGRRSQAGHFGTGPDPSGGRTNERPAKTWPAVVAVANQRRERGTRGRERVCERRGQFRLLTKNPTSKYLRLCH